MLEMRNGFVVTDDDCMQCRKDLGERKFLFIQAIWMGGDDEYFVVSNTEDLTEMSLYDIKSAIAGYYGSIESMEEINHMPLGQLDYLIAECSFESRPFHIYEYESEIVTWKRAEEIIQKFIDTDGEVFLEE